ncbi:hypothetical protein YB2330_003330 [Saitoella coloradoensis]
MHFEGKFMPALHAFFHATPDIIQLRTDIDGRSCKFAARRSNSLLRMSNVRDRMAHLTTTYPSAWNSEQILMMWKALWNDGHYHGGHYYHGGVKKVKHVRGALMEVHIKDWEINLTFETVPALNATHEMTWSKTRTEHWKAQREARLKKGMAFFRGHYGRAPSPAAAEPSRRPTMSTDGPFIHPSRAAQASSASPPGRETNWNPSATHAGAPSASPVQTSYKTNQKMMVTGKQVNGWWKATIQGGPAGNGKAGYVQGANLTQISPDNQVAQRGEPVRELDDIKAGEVDDDTDTTSEDDHDSGTADNDRKRKAGRRLRPSHEVTAWKASRKQWQQQLRYSINRLGLAAPVEDPLAELRPPSPSAEIPQTVEYLERRQRAVLASLLGQQAAPSNPSAFFPENGSVLSNEARNLWIAQKGIVTEGNPYAGHPDRADTAFEDGMII